MSANRIEQSAEPKSRVKEATKVELFHPREHAILAKFFGQEDKLPGNAKHIDPEEIFPEEENYDEVEQGIACQKSHGGNDYRALKNAVARIALAPIRTSLPTWGGFGKDGIAEALFATALGLVAAIPAAACSAESYTNPDVM